MIMMSDSVHIISSKKPEAKKAVIIHYRYSPCCGLQNIMETPVQRGLVQFLIRSNKNSSVSDLLLTALNWRIHYVPLSIISLHISSEYLQGE